MFVELCNKQNHKYFGFADCISGFIVGMLKTGVLTTSELDSIFAIQFNLSI